jgi:hypothetical protein
MKKTHGGNHSSGSNSNGQCLSEVWYLDDTKKCYFVCSTFTQYLRLAILHLGIVGWQMVFSPHGLSMSTQQWMGMFCKERLCVYEQSRSTTKLHNSSQKW